MDPFWRSSVRLELRCSDEVQLPDLGLTFAAATERWLAAKGLQPVDVGQRDSQEALSFLRSELRRRAAQHGEDSPQLLPVLTNMIGQRPPNAEWEKIAARAARLLKGAGAPADVRIATEMAYLTATLGKDAPRKNSPQENLLKRRERLSALLAELEQRGEDRGRAGAWVRAELAATYGATGLAEARRLYRQVAEAPPSQLPERDPIREAARAQLASLPEAEKRAGTQPMPCALIEPVPINDRIDNSAFPDEAIFWGFSGWAKVAFDITAQGQPANLRTVTAYPPFIFGPATERAIARFRYEPLPARAGTIGCSSMTQRVRFVMPR